MPCWSNSLRSTRTRGWTLFAVTVSALSIVLLLGDPPAHTTPDSVVHSADPLTLIFKREAQLAQLPAFLTARQQSVAQPANAEQSSAAASLALEMYQSTGNTRFLGAAKSAIEPWTDAAQPPQAIWLLRGRILQTEHEFADAALDLSRYNIVHYAATEALLLEADAWRRAGEITRAKRACLSLAFHGRTDLATYCSAEVLLTVGQGLAARELVEPIIDSSGSLPLAQKQWAMAIYADLLSATGHPEESAKVWKAAIASDRTPLSYKLAYADVLLSLSRFQAAIDLLGDGVSTTAALLRLTLAATSLGQNDAPALKSELERRFAKAKMTDTPDLHLREEALYALWLQDDASESLRLAVRNWELQKGWEDTSLVLHVADILNSTATLERVKGWQHLHATGDSI